MCLYCTLSATHRMQGIHNILSSSCWQLILLTGSRFSLSVNPLLVLSVSSAPSLTLPLQSVQVEQPQTPSLMVIVAEEIPPVQTKLIEQMWCLDYVDLSKLLADQDLGTARGSHCGSGWATITNGSCPERPT